MPIIIGEVEEREEGVIEWTIKDFESLLNRVGESHFSPSFSFGGAHWSLKCYPNGKDNTSEEYIVVYLYRESIGPPMQVNFSLGLNTANDEIFRTGYGTNKFEDVFDNAGMKLRRPRYLRRRLAPSGRLIIVCRMKHPPSTDAARENGAFGSEE